ncbi:MAG: tail-specific protease, partial [Bacteroidota bacterium]
MKKLFTIVFLLVLIVTSKAQNINEVLSKDHSIDTNKVIVPDEIHKRVSQVIAQFLPIYHYKKQGLNDSLSVVIFDGYLEMLDNNKLYFLKSDVERFEKYKTQLDEFLRGGDLKIAYEIFNLFKKRLGERIKFVDELLKQKFDF